MTSVLTPLRDLVPIRALTRAEAMRVAELQATRMLELLDVHYPPVPQSMITEHPRVVVRRLSPLPVSGSTHWAKGTWVIALNGAEAPTRQRFSLAHEFKHVLDHPFIEVLYPQSSGESRSDRAEFICDYFAASLLMPRSWVKKYYCNEGIQNLRILAAKFGVSPMAMQVRLLQLGLVEQPRRCQTYFRAASISV